MKEVAEKVREIVGMSFGVDPKTLNISTTAGDVEGWDSLAHATLVLRLQRIFNIRLAPDEANGAQDLGRLIALIETALKPHG